MFSEKKLWKLTKKDCLGMKKKEASNVYNKDTYFVLFFEWNVKVSREKKTEIFVDQITNQ